MHQLGDEPRRRLEPDPDLPLPEIRVPGRDSARREGDIVEDHPIEAGRQVPAGNHRPLSFDVPGVQVQVAHERRFVPGQEVLGVENAVAVRELEVRRGDLLHVFVHGVPGRQILVQVRAEIRGAGPRHPRAYPGSGLESQPGQHLLPVVGVAHDGISDRAVRHRGREFERGPGSDHRRAEVPAVLVERGQRVSARVSDAREARPHVAREVAPPLIRDDILAANGNLIVPKIGVVLVHQRRADQVVLGRVRPVGEGADVERNLSQLEVEITPLGIREAHEAAEEPRLRRAVVVDEFREDVDVILDRGVGEEADPGRVERVLAEVERVDPVLVVPGLADQIQVAGEVHRTHGAALGPRREEKQRRDRRECRSRARGRNDASVGDVSIETHGHSLWGRSAWLPSLPEGGTHHLSAISACFRIILSQKRWCRIPGWIRVI